jgi:hypothetical protein
VAMSCKTYPAKQVLSTEFLQKAERGLLLESDEAKKTICFGYIRYAIVGKEAITFLMSRTIKKWGDSEWELLANYTFRVNPKGFMAMDHRTGYFFSNPIKDQMTFRVYPASAVEPLTRRDDMDFLSSLYEELSID